MPVDGSLRELGNPTNLQNLSMYCFERRGLMVFIKFPKDYLTIKYYNKNRLEVIIEYPVVSDILYL